MTQATTSSDSHRGPTLKSVNIPNAHPKSDPTGLRLAVFDGELLEEVGHTIVFFQCEFNKKLLGNYYVPTAQLAAFVGSK